MNKFVLLTILLIACFGCAAVEAQVDRDQNSQAPCVVVAGAVHSPMRFELKRRPVKVLEALAFAGGPTQRASGTIKLIRTGEPCYQEAWAHKVWPDHRLEVTELAFADIQRGTGSADRHPSRRQRAAQAQRSQARRVREARPVVRARALRRGLAVVRRRARGRP